MRFSPWNHPFSSASLAAVSALLLTACSDLPASYESGEIDEAELAQTVCAAGTTVEGIDVSFWQAAVNWQSVKNAGIGFAIVRVSYGTSKDTWFDTNWQGMKDVGLVRGAYQFFLPDQDPIAQADLMLSAMGPLGEGDLPPVLDVEDTGGLGPAALSDRIATWIAHVEPVIGRKPIIYTGKYFWQDNVQSTAFGEYPLWIPNYSFNCPNLPDGYWNDWLFFQYTDKGSVPGVSGNVDRNLWNGSLADLKAFANGGPAYAAKFVSQSFPYSSVGTFQIPAGGSAEVSIELQNVGTKPWDENTLLGTTEPRDRTSPFAGPEWPAPNRYARVSGTVLPGETFTFTFTMHAPTDIAVYDEHMSVVQEGVAWFGDPGQGGPPDNQLEGLFEVVPGMGSGGAGGQGGAGVGGAGGSGGAGGAGGSDATPGGEGGCQCSFETNDRNGLAGSLVVLLGLGALRRRRRR